MEVLASLLLALVFTGSVAGKWRDRGRFEEYLKPLVGRRASTVRDLTMASELGLAAMLSLAVSEPTLLPFAGGASAVFLLVATAVQAALLVRRGAPTCRCFGRLSNVRGRLDGSWHPALFALRNAILMAVSITAAEADVVIALPAAAAIVGVTAFGLISSVRAERRLIAREIHPLTNVYGTGMRTLMAHLWWVNGRPRPF